MKREQQKRVMAKLFVEGIHALDDECLLEDIVDDYLWTLVGKTGDEEDRWVVFYSLFEDLFGISYTDAEFLVDNELI